MWWKLGLVVTPFWAKMLAESNKKSGINHATRTSVDHHQSSPHMEPQREEKERTANKHLVKSAPGKHPENRHRTKDSEGSQPITYGGEGLKNKEPCLFHVFIFNTFSAELQSKDKQR